MSLPELTCAACGHRGYDVATAVVEVEPTETVTVYAATPPVHERFRVQARCVDHDACAERVLEATA